MDPHPEQEDQPEVKAPGRAGIIAVVVIGAIFLVVIALHLAGVMGPSAHG